MLLFPTLPLTLSLYIVDMCVVSTVWLLLVNKWCTFNWWSHDCCQFKDGNMDGNYYYFMRTMYIYLCGNLCVSEKKKVTHVHACTCTCTTTTDQSSTTCGTYAWCRHTIATTCTCTSTTNCNCNTWTSTTTTSSRSCTYKLYSDGELINGNLCAYAYAASLIYV